MNGTVTASFRVAEIVDGHIWLEVERGPGEGSQVAVPTDGAAYDEELRRKIRDLTEGERIEAELESENERNTAWHVRAIHDDHASSGPGPRAPADD